MNNYKKLYETLNNEEKEYILKKAMEYQKILNIENEGGGWNDTTDGFRHAWGSAYLALKYNDLISNAATSAYEFMEHSYQPQEEKEMDIWNNKIGREIAKELSKEYKDIDKTFNRQSIEDLIAVKALEKIENNELMTSTANLKKGNLLQGYVEYNEPLSLKDRLTLAREDKLARYTQRLAESPEKIAQMQANLVSLEELKAPQEARKQKVRDIVEGKVQFDENADLSGYVNQKSNDNKIFTQEDIDEMTEQEKKENAQAIMYQKQTIGVPTREQAQKVVSKGGMVHVRAYTRADGTKVRSHYRSR